MRPVFLQLDFFMSSQFAGIATAIRRGLYDNLKLRVSLEPPCVPGQEVARVLQGSQQREGTWLGTQEQNVLVPLIHQGAAVRAVSAMFGSSPLCLAARPGDSRLETAGGATGLRIGAHEDTSELIRRIVPNSTVLDVERTEKLRMLISGEIDAVQVYDVMETKRLSNALGAELPVYSFNRLGRIHGNQQVELGYAQTIFAPCSQLSDPAHRSVLVDFLRATYQGWWHSITTPREAAEAVMSLQETGRVTDHWEDSEEFTEWSVRACNEYVKTTRRAPSLLGSIDPLRWEKASKWLVEPLEKKGQEGGQSLDTSLWQPRPQDFSGYDVAARLSEETERRATAIREKRGGKRAKLTVVTIGTEPLGETHSDAERRRQLFSPAWASWFDKKTTGASLGIDVEHVCLPSTASTEEVVAILRAHPHADGVQLMWPLPPHVDRQRVYGAIPVDQDVDDNAFLAGGAIGVPKGVSVTPTAVLMALESGGVPVNGSHVLVIGRSPLVGTPLARMLESKGATVSVAHSQTSLESLKALCGQADVIISCVGTPGVIRAEWAKEGAALVNVGTSFDRQNDRLEPDIAGLDGPAAELSAFVASTPGGVGPLSVQVLFQNVVRNAEVRDRAEMSRPVGATEHTETVRPSEALKAAGSLWSLKTGEGVPGPSVGKGNGQRETAAVSLTRDLRFPSYTAASEFISDLTRHAEAVNHHPNLSVVHHCSEGATVSVSLSSYSKQGRLTLFDLDLAKAVDALYPQHRRSLPLSPPNSSSSETLQKSTSALGALVGEQQAKILASPLSEVHKEIQIPDDRIAIRPAVPRGSSRLLTVLPSETVEPPQGDPPPTKLTPAAAAVASFVSMQQEGVRSGFLDLNFSDLPSLLPPKAHLFFNHSRVVAARLFARHDADGREGEGSVGSEVEVMFLAPEGEREGGGAESTTDTLAAPADGQKWRCMVRLPAEDLAMSPVLSVQGADGRSAAALTVERIASVWEEEGETDGVEAVVRVDPCPISFPPDTPMHSFFESLGSVPVPPYLKRRAVEEDSSDYQTVYASPQWEGSVAAPTAGLHFTPAVLSELRNKGITSSFGALHVSAGTFRPVTAETAAAHQMHSEGFACSGVCVKETAQAVREGRPLVAVGTTSLRLLESLYCLGVRAVRGEEGPGGARPVSQWDGFAISSQESNVPVADALDALYNSVGASGVIRGETALMIAPGYHVRTADVLVTNFHQPDSTLLLLVAAFVGGREAIVEAYRHAVREKYRFFSYGDACVLFNQSLPSSQKSNQEGISWAVRTNVEEGQKESEKEGGGIAADDEGGRETLDGALGVGPPLKVLLHSCCAPCSGAMVEEMAKEGHDVTVFFYNPNIHPREEYELRKEENKKFAASLGIPFVDADYDTEKWFSLTKGMEWDPERGRRCTVCFDMRMDRAAEFANAHGFDAIATTNATSRWKDREQVDDSGRRAASRFPGLQYLDQDWRTEEMTQRKYRINAERSFYKQEYCGCSFSLRDVNLYRKQEGLPAVRPARGSIYSDPERDAEEESQEVVDAFFEDTMSPSKEEMRIRLRGLYRQRKRSETGSGTRMAAQQSSMQQGREGVSDNW